MTFAQSSAPSRLLLRSKAMGEAAAWHLFHRWSKWEPIGKGGADIVQERRCLICGKIQREWTDA